MAGPSNYFTPSYALQAGDADGGAQQPLGEVVHQQPQGSGAAPGPGTQPNAYAPLASTSAVRTDDDGFGSLYGPYTRADDSRRQPQPPTGAPAPPAPPPMIPTPGAAPPSNVGPGPEAYGFSPNRDAGEAGAFMPPPQPSAGPDGRGAHQAPGPAAAGAAYYDFSGAVPGTSAPAAGEYALGNPFAAAPSPSSTGLPQPPPFGFAQPLPAPPQQQHPQHPQQQQLQSASSAAKGKGRAAVPDSLDYLEREGAAAGTRGARKRRRGPSAAVEEQHLRNGFEGSRGGGGEGYASRQGGTRNYLYDDGHQIDQTAYASGSQASTPRTRGPGDLDGDLNGDGDSAAETALDDGAAQQDEAEPLYVNAKQYHRILKRRVARARLEEMGRLSRERKVRRGSGPDPFFFFFFS